MANNGFSQAWNNTNISLALDPSGAYQHCSLEYSRSMSLRLSLGVTTNMSITAAIVHDRLYLDAGETRMMIGNDSGNPLWEISTLTFRNRSFPSFFEHVKERPVSYLTCECF